MWSNCTTVGPNCPADGSGLSYPPNLAANIIFAALFGFSLIVHIFQGWRLRTWSFLAAYALGSSTEVVGYIGRILFHSNPYDLNRFLVQIVCLTMGPAFYSAGLYLCLARIVIVYGEEISRIRPAWYTRIFITCDLISLALQGGGGGVASSATKPSTLSMGNNIMLAGLIFQIVTLVLFAVLCLEFSWRVHRSPHMKNVQFRSLRDSRRFRGFLLAAVATFVLIFVRCVYRVVELAGGWNNHLQREEVPFIILESGMITVAVFVFAVYHPGYAFKDVFGALRASVSSNDIQKGEIVEMRPESVETLFRPNKQAASV
ncbi:conserved hypothetical protein [Talaromyces stipitatus ATCC 10500]|uniref:RTA1 domain protein n=1 Tax=Talaromyces stipitatus (strain ATCC 10500 / CBS 375.48 / QM 6759 / NRRL 1006) TaxID=441959 RepID=B8MFE3_TALSN|nr:uncharacterized protein TSTA_017520 [Talaromyces stipitatus ATCC 10500]EED16677.1 conserved hypothetical protein [Talaromyces stipitatus ATCC 10500]